jgi:CheY-like chemotaxis protein
MARTITTSTKGLRALVLDGDPASLRSLTRSLEGVLFSVCTASDGARGLDRLLEELLSLDVLVIDAALPDRDALAFAELIRRVGGERDLAIVVVAASPAPALRTALLSLGVDAVVERGEGPDAAALAAVAAVASRAARSLDLEAAPPAASEPELELESVPAPFALPFAGGWSMLAA